MELKLVRGVVADLTPPEKNGCAVCRIGDRKIQLHRDLSTAAKVGDDVLVGGELRADVVHAVALNNFTRKKLSQVDFTFHVLGVGFVFMVVVFGFYFSGEQTPSGLISNQVLATVLLVGGFSGGFMVVRRVLRIVKITRWVAGVEK